MHLFDSVQYDAVLITYLIRSLKKDREVLQHFPGFDRVHNHQKYRI